MKNCYVNSLKLAEKLTCKTVAFPCISTGVYRFPKQAAAQIAVSTVRQFSFQYVQEIIFVCFGTEDKKIYEQLLKGLHVKNLIGCCGLDCQMCDAYLATLHNDDDLRKKTARLWSQLNNAPITPDMINCTGCRANGVKTFFCTHLCKVRRCVKNKGFETCGQCPELKTCATVAQIHKHNPNALKNLNMLN